MSCPPAHGSGKSVSSSLSDTIANGSVAGMRPVPAAPDPGDSSSARHHQIPAAAAPVARTVEVKKLLRVIPRRVMSQLFNQNSANGFRFFAEPGGKPQREDVRVTVSSRSKPATVTGAIGGDGSGWCSD